MKRKTVIVILTPNKDPLVRGNFKKTCEELELPYHSLKSKKFPIIHGNYTFYRVPFVGGNTKKENIEKK